MRPDALVVLPTYNEVESITGIVDALLPYGTRILVVDDASPDGTGAVADEIARHEERVSVLHRARKEGLGPAYAAGFAWGLDRSAAILIEMDADFSHDPAKLPAMIAAVDDGADLVIGSRYVPGGGIDDWPWHRRLLSWGGNRYAGLLLGVPVRDLTSGFRAFRAEALAGLRPGECETAGYGFQVEMAWRASAAGLRIVEIPIRFRDRRLGASKMTPQIAFEAMVLVTRWGLRRISDRLRWRTPEE